MAIGKLSSSPSLRDVVTGHVAVVRRRLAEVVARAASSSMAPVSWHPGSGGSINPGPLHGATDHGTSVDDRR
jgi:hypothetical protein